MGVPVDGAKVELGGTFFLPTTNLTVAGQHTRTVLPTKGVSCRAVPRPHVSGGAANEEIKQIKRIFY